LWGDGLSRRAYAQWNSAQEQTDWGRAHLRRLALVDGNRVMATAKRYDLLLTLDGRQVPTVGVGAVFTPAPLRGHGHARAIIDALLDAARGDGAELALLFSEIGPNSQWQQQISRCGSSLVRRRSSSVPAKAPTLSRSRRCTRGAVAHFACR